MGKFRDERYGRTLAEKRVKILQMAVDAVKLARAVRRTTSSSMPKMRGAPSSHICSRWSRPSLTRAPPW